MRQKERSLRSTSKINKHLQEAKNRIQFLTVLQQELMTKLGFSKEELAEVRDTLNAKIEAQYEKITAQDHRIRDLEKAVESILKTSTQLQKTADHALNDTQK